MKCGIVVFPGSNCDHDCYHVLKEVYGVETHWIWHKDRDLGDCDFVVLPGGFSYGDYLRAGAIAKFSPIMKEVVRFAKKGGRVMGICNGFQILVESGLLPGALLRNRSQKFICRNVHLRVENAQTPFTALCEHHAVLQIPVNHGEGAYYADSVTLRRLDDHGQVLFRYCSPDGEVDEASNPNGSVSSIAGIVNEARNVMGMMPHPERCADPLWPQVDGRFIFDSLIRAA